MVLNIKIWLAAEEKCWASIAHFNSSVIFMHIWAGKRDTERKKGKRFWQNYDNRDRKMFAVNGHFMESPSWLLSASPSQLRTSLVQWLLCYGFYAGFFYFSYIFYTLQLPVLYIFFFGVPPPPHWSNHINHAASSTAQWLRSIMTRRADKVPHRCIDKKRRRRKNRQQQQVALLSIIGP